MDYFLATDDVVGISFWIATAVMAAGALFFFVERSTVKASWQTSLTVAALVCFVAFWVQTRFTLQHLHQSLHMI